MKKGEKVANYLEASQELAYKLSRTDDPSLAPLHQIQRASQYRAEARLRSDGDQARWDKGRS